jgi:hypothetical protein
MTIYTYTNPLTAPRQCLAPMPLASTMRGQLSATYYNSGFETYGFLLSGGTYTSRLLATSAHT